MKNKQNNNRFLIIWSSCIVFLLVLCFFGVSDMMKGTRAAYECPVGYPNLSGSRCYKEVDAKASISYSAIGSCSCKGSTSTASGSCSCSNSGGQYIGGTCTTSGCSCPSGYPTVSSNMCKSTPNTWSGTCDASGGSAKCLCGGGSVTSNSCGVTSSTSYSCSEGTQVGDKCRIYVDAIKDDGDFADANYFGTLADVMYRCKSVNDGVECDCKDLGVTSDGTHAFKCSPKSGSGNGDNSNCTHTKHPGGNYSCTLISDGCWSCKLKDDSGDPDNSSCTYLSQGHCEGVTGRKCVYGEDKCWYAASASGTKPARSCTEEFGSVANGYWAGMCETVENADGSYKFICQKGNNCQLACVSGYTLENGQCVKCEDCDPCENPKCYYNSSTGAYSWGTYAEISGWEETSLSQSQCKNDIPSSENPGDDDPDNDSPNNPSNPSNPSDAPSSPSSSNPTSSGRPSSSSNPENRGDGCYKNKDTGEFKWFNSDPELNSQTNLYEKVDDSKCSSVPKPSSDGNITETPQTGEIAIFLIWILGFGAVGYSVWYYIKSRKEN